MSTRWSQAEDAVLRQYAAHGPSWIIENGLLPGRKYAAICARRKSLGIQFSRGEKGHRPKPLANWTDEQRCSMLVHAIAMTKDSGHTFRECMFEIARLQREHAKGGMSE